MQLKQGQSYVVQALKAIVLFDLAEKLQDGLKANLFAEHSQVGVLLKQDEDHFEEMGPLVDGGASHEAKSDLEETDAGWVEARQADAACLSTALFHPVAAIELVARDLYQLSEESFYVQRMHLEHFMRKQGFKPLVPVDSLEDGQDSVLLCIFVVFLVHHLILNDD